MPERYASVKQMYTSLETYKFFRKKTVSTDNTLDDPSGTDLTGTGYTFH